ncbi:MAG: efflux transporter outer membrane subunit, partial [Desulfonatronovibrionaceae bacterium]
MPKLLLLLALLAAGCSAAGPDYTRPEIDLPGEWSQTRDPALTPNKEEIRNWWRVFRDPVLNWLIQDAAGQNLDLRSAVARVDEARAKLKEARGGYWPSIDASGAAARQESRGTELQPQGTLDTYYTAGMEAGWELDLFGRIRRSVQASSADFQASQEERTDIMISVYAEVARTYINIRTLQSRLDTTRKNITSQKEILGLTRARFKHGLASDLDVARAEQVLANTRAQIPPLRTELTESKNSLAILLGLPPGELEETLGESGKIPVPPERTAYGVPADLLRRRPDIRSAERSLAAQTARIGVAEAELYPAFSLTGSLDYMHTGLNDMFIPAHRAFSFGPSVRWNLFNGGRIRAQIEVEDARTEQALTAYEKTVLTALSEVENAATGYWQQKDQLAALRDAVQACKR